MRVSLRLAAIALGLAVSACADSGADESAAADPSPDFATQLDAPAPDYAAMLAGETLPDRVENTSIKASAPPPPDAAQIGEVWRSRLDARDALGGLGYSGNGPGNGAVRLLDTLLSREDFNAMVRENGWTVPRHIDFNFVERLSYPAVADEVANRIRYWPQRRQRTGAQNMAALYGKVYLKDGCLFVDGLDGKTSLAWFLAETGLDLDEEGYFILIDRRTGWTMGRLGETMSWAGPNGEPTAEETASLRASCGDYPVADVGNPHSEVRFEAELERARQDRR
ncbi:hypothetical protein K3175_09210 [Qipengyuania sp. GH1]|uniref:hypothetical protein n=1 Tax=Qipengyuania aestuarii TaxID=2867241 RepID=UPI001C871741|nr:hypothetical protein [Qipengyuania aestuarii]MBX7535841.1 hypothetical protein [Qipengyuania aestuarii]